MMTDTQPDRWITHDGGPCPVPPETLVEVQGVIVYTPPAASADYWDWIAVKRYRIVQPASPATPSPVRQRTVTEIVPGVYGRFEIGEVVSGPAIDVWMVTHAGNRVVGACMTPAELRAAASTLTQIADAMENEQ